MSENSEEAQRQTRPDEADRYESLANEVLSRVAVDAPSLRAASFEAQINRLCEAAANSDPDARDQAISDLLAEGVSHTDLIDKHIPAAARELGQRWREDRVSFADVTIGVARLQGILRDLADGKHSLIYSGGDGGLQIAMVVPEDEHHTLGALVATNQMRRDGRTVRLILGKSPREVTDDILDYGVDVVMISASVSTRLQAVQLLVEAIRSRTRERLQIVVGGSFLGHNPTVKQITGVDFMLADPKEALTKCEQIIQLHGEASCAPSD